MKRKFLLLVCAVLCILQANAYTTDDLLSDGWSLAPNFSSNKDYVYVLVDAGSGEYVMTSNPSDAGARPQYMALVNPFTNPKVVWTIESRNDGYALRNIDTQYYFNTNTNGYDNFMASTYETGSFDIIANGAKYDLKRISGTQGDGWYVGPWGSPSAVNTSAHPGGGYENIAANKATSLGFYIYQMAKATYAKKYLQNCPNLTAPVDVSFLIENPTIYQGGSATDLPAGWLNYDNHTTDDRKYTEGTNNTKLIGYRSAGWLENHTLDFDYYSGVNNLSRGQYTVSADVSCDKNHADLYICNTSSYSKIPTAMNSSSGNISASVAVGDNESISIGLEANISINNTSATATADNFRLQVNPYLSTMATALSFPGSASLTAGVWYYYDIPAENSYDFTSSAAATIYYTQAADPLLDASTTPEAFTAGQTKAISLSASRVYFKASEATTFSVAYRYNVGSATLSNADGSYTQNSTFSVTYSAATNDPSASPDLVASSKATVNGNEVALSAVTNGFSLNLGSLTANTDYRIVIPAGVYGYAGESMNAAIDVTIHTPAVLDGFYFLKTADNQYLSRGASYNTQAIADNTGLPLRVTTNSSNITSIIFVDNWFHLFDADNGNLFTDDNHDVDFQIQATDGGYYVVNKNETTNSTLNGKLYYDSEDGNRVKVSTSNATVWLFEDATTSAHKTQMQAVKDAQAAGVAATAGITVSTQAALNTILSSNYNATPVAITGTGGTVEQNYQGGASNVTGNELAIFEEETVSGLTPGLYKLTVNAFERITWLDDVLSVGGASGLTYLYANDQKVRLCSLADTYKEGSAWSEGTPEDISKTEGYYVNNTTSAGVAFTAGHYLNEVFVYVTDEGDGTGSIRFGIKKPHRYGNDGSRGAWVCYNNFTLTRYEQTEVTMKTFKAGSYGTFIAPFDVTIPSGVTASKVTGHVGNLLTLEDLTTTIPKNTPVVVYSEDAINETFKGKDGSNGLTSYTEGLLTGIYTAADIAEGNYVLQTNGGVQGFYQVGDGGLTGVPYRAYLNSSALGVKAFFFGNDADGIDSVQGLGFKVQDSEIFNLAGQKMSKLQKGVNIVNGKKILVK